MKAKIFYYLILTLTVSISHIACSPEDGRDGIDGIDGEQGEDGTANVMYSDWMPISWNETDEPLYKVMSIVELLITEEFITTGGTVLMFFKYELANVVLVLPFPLTQGNDLLSYYYGTDGSFSGIVVTAHSLDGTTPLNNYINPDYNIRYVLIPGGIPLGKNSQQNWEQVDKRNYEEVAICFGIQD